MRFFKHLINFGIVALWFFLIVSCTLAVKKTYYKNGKLRSHEFLLREEKLGFTDFPVEQNKSKRVSRYKACFYWLDSPDDCNL